MPHPKIPYPCPKCGDKNTDVDRSVQRGDYIRRARTCLVCNIQFRTYQNGAGEVFDSYVIAGLPLKGEEYRQRKQTYLALKSFTDVYGDWRVQACLERARQKAGIMKVLE